MINELKIIPNPYRLSKESFAGLDDFPLPSHNADAPLQLIKRCPEYAVTPLVEIDGYAGFAKAFVKDERGRMGLGSFKALGAAYVIADLAQKSSVADMTFVTASAGNHGMSVAAGAKAFGAKAVIYLSEHVPEVFAEKLRALGAGVERTKGNYEASMEGAQKAAIDNGWVLLSDSSWDGYFELSHKLMEGYLVLAAEIDAQLTERPSHIFLQAGVGGLACAVSRFAREVWGEAPIIVIVEPVAAPALIESIENGRLTDTVGPSSNMGRLDCKTPSAVALKGLAQDADFFLTISDEQVDARLADLTALDLETSASGGAAMIAPSLLSDEQRNLIFMNDNSTALFVISEEPC